MDAREETYWASVRCGAADCAEAVARALDSKPHECAPEATCSCVMSLKTLLQERWCSKEVIVAVLRKLPEFKCDCVSSQYRTWLASRVVEFLCQHGAFDVIVFMFEELVLGGATSPGIFDQPVLVDVCCKGLDRDAPGMWEVARCFLRQNGASQLLLHAMARYALRQEMREHALRFALIEWGFLKKSPCCVLSEAARLPDAVRALGTVKRIAEEIGVRFTRPDVTGAECACECRDLFCHDSVLESCVQHDTQQVVQFMFDNFECVPKLPSFAKRQLFVEATNHGRVSAMEFLRENCAGVNVNQQLADSSLIAAIKSRQMEAARYLVESCGADPHCNNSRPLKLLSGLKSWNMIAWMHTRANKRQKTTDSDESDHENARWPLTPV